MIINTLQVVHNYNWESIEAEESIIELPDVVKNLSTDTKNCYRLIKATTTGEFSGDNKVWSTVSVKVPIYCKR